MPPVVVPAHEWRRQSWRSLPAMPVPVDELWAHHSGAGSKTFQTLLGNERYHVADLGWRALGYSFAIVVSRIDGGYARIFEGRGWGKVGAHTSGRNTISHGVLLVGGWQSATVAEIEAAARSLAWLASEGARRGQTVEVVSGGHRQAPGQSTSCPETAGLEVVGRARTILKEDDMPTADEVARAVWGFTDNRTDKSMQFLVRNAYEFAVIAARREIDGQVDVDELAEGLRGALGDDLASEVVDALAERLKR